MLDRQINLEWRAWHQVCQELQKFKIDINKENALANAIRLWGEELHQLRLTDPEHATSALISAREAIELCK